jgi:hypothetical protein
MCIQSFFLVICVQFGHNSYPSMLLAVAVHVHQQAGEEGAVCTSMAPPVQNLHVNKLFQRLVGRRCKKCSGDWRQQASG